MNNLSEFLRPTPPGDLNGKVVEAVSDIRSDEPPSSEGNDAIHGAETGREQILSRADMSVPRPGVRIAPYVRQLRRGAVGDDVIAEQRALRAAHFRSIPPTGRYGPTNARNVFAFQKARGLEPSGVYGLLTHQKLKPFFDSYGCYLLMQALKDTREQRLRSAIVAAGFFSFAHREAIHYSQGSERLDGVRYALRPPKFPTHTDCSGWLTWLYWVAGAPDPCGAHYNLAVPHWTGTMATAGRRVDTPSLGDYVLYGANLHVALYVGGGRVLSNGSEPGPLLLDMHYRGDFRECRSVI